MKKAVGQPSIFGFLKKAPPAAAATEDAVMAEAPSATPGKRPMPPADDAESGAKRMAVKPPRESDLATPTQSQGPRTTPAGPRPSAPSKADPALASAGSSAAHRIQSASDPTESPPPAAAAVVQTREVSFGFLRDKRDANMRKPGTPGYDPTTMSIKLGNGERFTPGQEQVRPSHSPPPCAAGGA